MSNLEVSVAILLLEDYSDAPVLQDEGAAGEEPQEAQELLRTVREAMARLRSMGYDESAVFEPTNVSPEVIRISREYRITLPSRAGEELRLPPLLKTVFILFLKHPEGLSFKELDMYREELLQIYSVAAPGVDDTLREKRVDRLVSPLDGSIHIVRSKLSRNLEKYFPKPSVDAYRIVGKSGENKFIGLDRTLIEWE